jgi:hypothetical protein
MEHAAWRWKRLTLINLTTRNLHLSITTLVDELTDRLEVRVTISNVWLDNAEHLNGSLGQTNKDGIVDLEKTQKLKGLALLWINLVDTLDTNNESKLWLGRDVERAFRLGNTSKADLLTIGITVFLDVCLGALEDGLTLLLVGLLR